jgi:hypothetical protein
MTIEYNEDKAALLYFQYKELIEQKIEEIRKLNDKCSKLHYNLFLKRTKLAHEDSESESNHAG